MVQQPSPAALAFCVGAGLRLGCTTCCPDPCLWPGKAAEDGSSPEPLHPHRGDLEETPGSGLAVVVIWGVNQWMKDLCFFSVLSFK